MDPGFSTDLYVRQKSQTSRAGGPTILTTVDSDDGIILYTVMKREIADYGIKHGHLCGQHNRFCRRLWLTTDFLCVMNRSLWGSVIVGERCLALHVDRTVLTDILQEAVEMVKTSEEDIAADKSESEVVFGWYQYIDPVGSIDEIQSLLLGLKGDHLQRFTQNPMLKNVEDISDFLLNQNNFVKNDRLDEIELPEISSFVPEDTDICRKLKLDGYTDDSQSENTSYEEGWCFSELFFNSFSGEPANDNVFRGSRIKDVVINLFGAFNPVHTRHLAALVEARKFLEENTNYRVIGGHFSVTPDESLKKKFPSGKVKTIKGKHRIKLCELACKEYDWIQPLDRTVTFTNSSKLIQKKNKKPVKIAHVFGTDRALNENGKGKWRVLDDCITIIVKREGHTQKVKDLYEADLRSRQQLKQDFFFLPLEFENVSSTKIREKLACYEKESSKEGKAMVMNSLIKLGWMCETEAEYIMNNYKNLFF